jgi:hypothetical protein
LLGFFIVTVFLYYRFILERLPRDIPFNLSTLGFIIIIYIICIYSFIIFLLVRPPQKTNETIQSIINWLYTPLIDFDTYFKNLLFIKRYYNQIIIWLAYKLEYLFKHNLFDYIFYILPRAILIIVFIIDISYFGQLLYIYKVLWITIILLLRRYLLICI